MPLDDGFVRFWHTLVSAEHQLQWGTDLVALEEAKRALTAVRPDSFLIGQLEAKIRRIRRMEALLAVQTSEDDQEWRDLERDEAVVVPFPRRGGHALRC